MKGLKVDVRVQLLCVSQGTLFCFIFKVIKHVLNHKIVNLVFFYKFLVALEYDWLFQSRQNASNILNYETFEHSLNDVIVRFQSVLTRACVSVCVCVMSGVYECVYKLWHD